MGELRRALEPGQPLAAMADYPQFILWTVKQDEKTGRDYKVTVNPVTGANIDSQDSANWLTAAQATTLVEMSPYARGVGFVFTKADPFVFVDIDKCRMGDGSWSPVANDLMACLAGAAVEVSQSGSGLHIFGKWSHIDHSCKNTLYGAECYHTGRFVALTGDGVVGDASADISGPMADVVARYFPPKLAVRAEDWADKPTISGWAGPDDDDELIRIACESSSAAATFGTSATFRQLWECDGEALARFYPDTFGGDRAWDGSNVDGALVMHLAFWTGGNHERIKRLMLQTAHVRPKWDRVEGYLEPTISGGVARQSSAYYNPKYDPARAIENTPEVQAAIDLAQAQDAAPAPAPAPVVSEDVSADLPAVAKITSNRFMPILDQLKHFNKFVYVVDRHAILDRKGQLMKQGEFRASYGGYNFALDGSNEKTIRSAWEAFTESQGYDFPKVSTTCFKPRLEPGKIIGDAANIYFPADVKSEPGDVTPFINHVKKILPNERDASIMLSYMAGMVQHIGYKSSWAVLLQGVEGNGKTFFTECISHAVGKKYTHMPQAADIDNKFNAWLENKLFIAVEDIYVPANKTGVLEILKPMITGTEIGIQGKGIDQNTREICCNFLFNSNHKDAIKKSKNDRRFCILYTAQQEAEDLLRDGINPEYFKGLYDWFRKQDGAAYVTHFLRNYEIPYEFDFTQGAQRAPKTSSTGEAIAASLGVVEQEIQEAIDEARLGFRGGWVSSVHLSQLLDSKRLSGRVPPCKRGALMKSLGYITHPGLKGGSCNAPVACDGGSRPRLYILSDSVVNGQTGKAVAGAYEAAQTGLGA